MSDDPYAALGVQKTATDAEIKKAYRKIARDNHPDLNPDNKDAEARFKAASAAYDLLKDPELRARFDRGEIDASGAERPERQYYRDFANQRGNPYQAGQGFDGFEDASDLFAEFFRQQGQGRQGGGGRGGFSARGGDMRYALEISFADAALGATTGITLPDGNALNVKIPEGTADGQTIRLKGKGGPGLGGGPPGDALITIHVRDHPVFRRDGDDILLTLPITLEEAVLGAQVEAPTLHGPVKVRIPENASSGRVLRLRGRGVKTARSGKQGDQLVELRIVMPPQPDTALQEFLQNRPKPKSYDPRKGIKL